MFGDVTNVSASAHRGHLDDGSGIQKHSCDSLYPWTVRAIDSDGMIFYQAFNALTGWQGARYSVTVLGWSAAHNRAESDCEVAACWRR